MRVGISLSGGCAPVDRDKPQSEECKTARTEDSVVRHEISSDAERV